MNLQPGDEAMILAASADRLEELEEAEGLGSHAPPRFVVLREGAPLVISLYRRCVLTYNAETGEHRFDKRTFVPRTKVALDASRDKPWREVAEEVA